MKRNSFPGGNSGYARHFVKKLIPQAIARENKFEDIIRQGYGRIAFGHSELDGLQHWGPAADEGRRAYGQVNDAMLPS